jgi:hypothetical protein
VLLLVLGEVLEAEVYGFVEEGVVGLRAGGGRHFSGAAFNYFTDGNDVGVG